MHAATPTIGRDDFVGCSSCATRPSTMSRQSRDTVPHPCGRTNVSVENARYTLEASSRALDLAVQMVVVALETAREEQRLFHSGRQADSM